MANTKISDLTEASDLDGTEEIPGVQEGGNVKVTPQQIADFTLAGTREKKLNTGAWDMSTDPSISIAHEIDDITKIISITASIRNDAGTRIYPVLVGYQNAVSGLDLFCSSITETDIFITRVGGSIFDTTDFDDAVINRGKILIKYEV